MIYPICDNRSLLFANEESVNTTSCSSFVFSLTNFSPLIICSICYPNRLFKAFASSSVGLITWAAKERSNDASG
jgi:hypothetical protein